MLFLFLPQYLSTVEISKLDLFSVFQGTRSFLVFTSIPCITPSLISLSFPPSFSYHSSSFQYHFPIPLYLIPIPLIPPHSNTNLILIPIPFIPIPIPLFLIPTLIACPQCYVTRWNVLLCIRHSVSATGQVRVSQSALLRQPCGDNIQVYESPHNVLVGCPL